MNVRIPKLGNLREELRLVEDSPNPFRTDPVTIRRALHLRVFGHSYAEVGRMVGVDFRTVKRWIRRYDDDHDFRNLINAAE